MKSFFQYAIRDKNYPFFNEIDIDFSEILKSNIKDQSKRFKGRDH